jgi:hypothetical protein
LRIAALQRLFRAFYPPLLIMGGAAIVSIAAPSTPI